MIKILKKYFFQSLVVFFTFSHNACEEVDICDEISTMGIPTLILNFKNPQGGDASADLEVYKDGALIRDPKALELNSNKEKTLITFNLLGHKDEVGSIELTSKRKYVSKACGFKLVFGPWSATKSNKFKIIETPNADADPNKDKKISEEKENKLSLDVSINN